jgi:hypothetical protein
VAERANAALARRQEARFDGGDQQMIRRTRSIMLVSMLLGVPLATRGGDQPLPGLKLVLKDRAGRQRGVYVAKSALVALPAPGSADDPTASGGTVVVSNPDTGESASFPLPAEGWRTSSTGTVYRFTNRLAPGGPSPVKVAILKEGRVLKVATKATGITLDESTQGALEVQLVLGQTRWCSRFGGVLRDEPGRFVARNAPAPAACADDGATTTTTTDTSTTTTSEPATTTSTSTTVASTTTTSTFPPGCAPPAASLGSVAFTIAPGTTDCGGLNLLPGASPPVSGSVTNAAGTLLGNLGVGCLYVGAGQNGSLPGAALSDGSVALLDVAAANGLDLTLAASDGTGPDTCTRGAGPLRHCANGAAGTDTNGLCTADADCDGVQGSCVLDANCYFGAPTPVRTPVTALSTCTVNAIATDACGSANLTTGASTLDVAVYSRLYLTQDAVDPCPRCVAGVCSAGERAGLACTAVGTQGTSLDCPPLEKQFLGELPVRLAPLTTGTSVMTDPGGLLCADQRNRGAFGRGTARTVTQTGVPLTDLGSGTLFSTRLAGNFCIPSTGIGLIDNVVDLPGPGSVSVSGTIGVCLLPSVCGPACNPCLLGPLCPLLCNPCLLCL